MPVPAAGRQTREQKKAQTHRQLLEAAARVFARKGYRAASVDDVAAEAGFTKGAFYSNFDSKEDVFAALVEDRSRNWTMSVASAYATGGSLAERMEKGADPVLLPAVLLADGLNLFFAAVMSFSTEVSEDA